MPACDIEKEFLNLNAKQGNSCHIDAGAIYFHSDVLPQQSIGPWTTALSDTATTIVESITSKRSHRYMQRNAASLGRTRVVDCQCHSDVLSPQKGITRRRARPHLAMSPSSSLSTNRSRLDTYMYVSGESRERYPPRCQGCLVMCWCRLFL